jgi:hypothetical protein
MQIDPIRVIKFKFLVPKIIPTLNIVGKVWQGRFWTFSAMLRMIPASVYPKKILDQVLSNFSTLGIMSSLHEDEMI